jgi:uncharacterized protein (TIGR02679 family)
METEKNHELLFQAANYFKRPGFLRLFEGIRERYAALSHLGGKIQIKKLNKEESDELEGILQVHITEGKNLSVSIAQIKKALQCTRFDKCNLEEIVPLVLEASMESNKANKIRKEQEMEACFDRIVEGFESTPAGNWFTSGRIKGKALSVQMTKDYHLHKNWFIENMPLIVKAINHLPANRGNHVRLPLFAASVTGNPHYFDEGTRGLSYLLTGIRHLYGEGKIVGDSIEARTEILYLGGILKDDLSNWVLCFGIRGYVTDGAIHKGMEEYRSRQEPQILTLQNLSRLKAVDSMEKDVYVVENPSIFSHLVEQNPKGVYVCSGGQLRLSVLILLDLLVKNQITIHYSGDFDPEGLRIAQKLVSRYGNRLKLWCYKEDIYHKSKSNKIISERRLKQLDSLTDTRLKAIGELLKEYKHPGYQENIMEVFLEINPCISPDKPKV